MPKIYNRVADRTFVNPYNFVTLSPNCIKNINYQSAKEASDAISGWLECELELKSPIFIPNSSNDKFFGQWHPDHHPIKPEDYLKSFEFFSYDDLKKATGNCQNTPPPTKPVIPGSEIRGMIRSAYETLTNSCLSTIDPQMSFHKRAPKSNLSGQPGILRKNGAGWEIAPCKRYMLKTNFCNRDPFNIPAPEATWIPRLRAREKSNVDVHFNNLVSLTKTIRGNTITIGKMVQNNPLTYSSPTAAVGKVHVTAGFLRKHHDSVFVDTGNPPILITQEIAENYLENLKLCKDNDTIGPEYQHLWKGDDIDAYDNVCVYYAKYCGRIYLSPSMINREMLYKNLGERIGNFKPCDDPTRLCSACSLFGMVSDKGSVVSRLRFSDATPVEGTTEFMEPVLLEELASPKPSASEFYLERPANQDNWNYDYQMRWGQGGAITPSNFAGRIRGRKFYWHQTSIKTSNLLHQRGLDETTRNKLERMCLVRPLTRGVFKFKVYFDRVSRSDVFKLVYTMTIGFSTNHAHKIGMGKPLGLGSVQLKVSKLTRREFTSAYVIEKRHVDFYNDVNRNIIITNCEIALGVNGVLSQFKVLTELNGRNNICYPYVIDGQGNPLPESYRWFVGNKQIQRVGQANRPKIDQSLAEPGNPEQQVIRETE